MKSKFVSRLGLTLGKNQSSKISDAEPARPGDTRLPSEQFDTTDSDPHPTPSASFKYVKNVCALSWWEPIRLLEEGSISDIHLVKRRDHFVKVRYKEKRDVMDLAKRKSSKSTSDVPDTEVFVLKSIMKDHIGDDLVLDEMRKEIQTMSSLDHPNICRLVEAYERRRHIYLVMEFCSGGNLAGRIPMSEKLAAVVCRKVLSAVAYMHRLGVAHRDIKLENIMLDSKCEIKLIDFGLATAYLSDDYKTMTDKVGTLYSMAPQVLNGSYDERCDLWSVGVVSYLLLSGGYPFWGPTTSMPWFERRKIMIDLIKKCHYVPMKNKGRWQSISQAAKDFVKSLLQLNPDDRPSAKEALESKWIQAAGGQNVDDENDTEALLGVDVRKGEELEQLSNLRRKIWRLFSSKLTEDEIQDLRASMEANDENGEGLIHVEELLNLFKDAAKTTDGLSTKDVEELLVDAKTVDPSSRLNYVDLMIEVLIGRGRNTVESFARAVDDLDADDTRMVPADGLKRLIDAYIPSDLREELWNALDVDTAGTVNTSVVLSLVTKKVAKHHRDSIRSRSGRS